MSAPWWERAVLFGGVFVFVLVWVVKNFDYDNLVKWRGIVRKNEGNWTKLVLLGFFVMVLIATLSVYLFIIRHSN